jgi:single-stranded DNA-binding protein
MTEIIAERVQLLGSGGGGAGRSTARDEEHGAPDYDATPEPAGQADDDIPF